MLRYETSDLVLNKKYDYFCHQVNCQGVMGAGIAAQIAKIYPKVKYEEQKYWSLNYIRNHDTKSLLGQILAVKTEDGRTCVNMHAQDLYGREKICYTDYEAFDRCLIKLKCLLLKEPDTLTVGFPYKIGCGLAGGDWEKIQPMLEDFAGSIKQNVYIVKYDKG